MKLKDLVHQLLVLRLYFAQGKYQRSLLFGIANLVKCSITPTSLFTKHIYSFINSTERHTNKIKKRTRPETNIMNTRNFGTNKINSNSQSIISIERNIKTYKKSNKETSQNDCAVSKNESKLNLPLQLSLKTMSRFNSKSKERSDSQRIEKYDNLPCIRFITDGYGLNDFSISTNVLRSQSMLEKLKIRNKQLMRQELAYLKRNMQKSKNEGLCVNAKERNTLEQTVKLEFNSNNFRHINGSLSRLRNQCVSSNSRDNSERYQSNLTNSNKMHSIKKKRLILNKLELRSVENIPAISNSKIVASTKYLINNEIHQEIQEMKEKSKEIKVQNCTSRDKYDFPLKINSKVKPFINCNMPKVFKDPVESFGMKTLIADTKQEWQKVTQNHGESSIKDIYEMPLQQCQSTKHSNSICAFNKNIKQNEGQPPK